MANYKVLRDNLYGDCVGAIYIDMVNHASKVMLDAETLKEFCSRLYDELYLSDTWDNGEKIFCFNEHSFYFNDLQADLVDKDLNWFRVYHNHDCQFCDQIMIIEEEKIKKVILDCSDCCADIYSKIISEIASFLREPSAMYRFCRELYANIDTLKDFYISANESTYLIGNKPMNVEDPAYDSESRYYHYFHKDKERDDSDVKFVEIEWKGEQA